MLRSLLARAGAGPGRLGLLAALLVASCVAPPRHAVSVEGGVVRADDPALAAAAAELFVEARAGLAARVPGLQETTVDVWVQEEPRADFLPRGAGSFTAFTLQRRGANPRLHLPEDRWRETLTHELVHALLGESWEPLPQLVEEGLADLLGIELGWGPEGRLMRLADAAGEDSNLYTISWRIERPNRRPSVGSSVWGTGGHSPEEPPWELDELLAIEGADGWLELGSTAIDFRYGAGLVLAERLVERVGIDGLHRLCVEAAARGETNLDPRLVCELAGVEDLGAVISEARIGLPAARFAAALSDHSLGAALRRLIERRLAPAGDLDEFLATHQPRLAVGAGIELPLADVPGFRQWAEERWDTLAGDAR